MVFNTSTEIRVPIDGSTKVKFEETSFTMRTFGTTSNLVPIEIMTFIIENIQLKEIATDDLSS